MKRVLTVIAISLMLSSYVYAEEWHVWELMTEQGEHLTDICYEPSENDEYLGADNHLYRIKRVEDGIAIAEDKGVIQLPAVDWIIDAQPVSAKNRSIGMYCTHSDESYQPNDGYYSTTQRGSIYQVAGMLAEALQGKGIEVNFSSALHHPHDAGAYRRSRQTAVDILRTSLPDCLMDIHRDGIPDPAAYEVNIGEEAVSKIRLLVGRGNQNAVLNKEFALKIKAIADRVYPGLIKDIYLGKGAFNQDLLPNSILLECGTYTIDKDRVIKSMPMMADVLNRVLYGGIVGSAGHVSSDVQPHNERSGGVTRGLPDMAINDDVSGTGKGIGFLVLILVIGVGGIAFLSTGSFWAGKKKLLRNVNEMTGGLIGKPPEDDENHEHS